MRSNDGLGSWHVEAGSRCLAGPGGPWSEATVRTLNADGTVQIQFDEGRQTSKPYWYGVTRSEFSVDDAVLWHRIFPEVFGRSATVSRFDFADLMRRMGFAVEQGPTDRFWRGGVESLFSIAPAHSLEMTLDADQIYGMLLRAALSAKQIDERIHRPPGQPVCTILYWNQNRMGGRDPSEVARAVTLTDAFAALGVSEDLEDGGRRLVLESLEHEVGFALPHALRRTAGGSLPVD